MTGVIDERGIGEPGPIKFPVQPEPGIERAIELALENTDAQPLKPCMPPYSYRSPCYWAYKGAWYAIIAVRRRGQL